MRRGGSERILPFEFLNGGPKMPKYRHRGEAALEAVKRWEEIVARGFLGEAPLRLTERQRRTLRLQIKEAIVRWEKSCDSAS